MSLLNTVSEKLSAWRRYRETIRELTQLSDHELHDIGVHPGEIEYSAQPVRRQDHGAIFAPLTEQCRPAPTIAGTEQLGAVRAIRRRRM
jgi:uncharacterized protein YjiS (DUF1127 family)